MRRAARGSCVSTIRVCGMMFVSEVMNFGFLVNLAEEFVKSFVASKFYAVFFGYRGRRDGIA